MLCSPSMAPTVCLMPATVSVLNAVVALPSLPVVELIRENRRTPRSLTQLIVRPEIWRGFSSTSAIWAVTTTSSPATGLVSPGVTINWTAAGGGAVESRQAMGKSTDNVQTATRRFCETGEDMAAHLPWPLVDVHGSGYGWPVNRIVVGVAIDDSTTDSDGCSMIRKSTRVV